MLRSTFEPLSLFFSSSRFVFFEAPGAVSRLIRFHGSQQNTVGIPSAKRKRGTTGIRTANPSRRETYLHDE